MNPQKTLFPKLLLSLMLAVVCLLVLPAQAEAATFDGGSVQLEANLTEDVTVSADTYLDLNGFTLTGDVTVADGATLYVFDSATADYTAENRGKIVGTVTGNLARTMNTPETNYKYLTLQEADGSYSFHRYYLTVKSVVLVPYTEDADCASTAMNYKTVFKCNDVMAEYVTAYGVKLTGDDTVYTNHLIGSRVLTTGAEGVNKHTTRLAGIMKSTNTTEENAANALLAPVVNAYININDGLEAEITSADVTRSLKDMILYANGLAELTAKQEVLLDKMNELFEEVILSWTEEPEVKTVTISFADKANRTAFDTSTQVWEQNGITVTNNKGSSTSNVADYTNPARFYKSSQLIVEYPGMKSIIFETNGSDYANALDGSLSEMNGITVVKNSKTVAVVLETAADSFTIETLGGQVRMDSITVSTGVVEIEEEPETPAVPVPPADSALTIEEALALGAAMEHNSYTEGKYYVTGEITEVYNTQYGNMYIADEAGNKLTIYGTYSADGKTGYSGMATKPVAGDTVTIYGIVGQYNGTAQIKNGWITEHIAAEPDPSDPTDPSEPETPDTPAEAVKPEVGTAYNFGMIQEAVSTTDIYYLSGGMSSYYMASSNNAENALEIYLEPAEGGYYMFYMDGETKTYINMVVSGTHVNGAYEATALTVYTYDEEMQTVVAEINNGTYRFGTRNDKSYTTIGPVDVTMGNFYCKFYAVETGEDGGETPDTPVVPEDPDPTDPEPTDPEVTDPTEPEPTDPSEPGTEPEGPTATGYVKVTSVDEITTGKYVLVTANGIAPTVLDGSWVLAGTPVVENDAITEANAAGFIWDLTVDGTAVKLTDANGVTIAPKGGNENGIKSGDYSWTITVNDDGTVTFAGVGSDTVYLTSNGSSSNQFRGYKMTTVTGNTTTYKHVFTLYKLVEA